MQEQVYIEDFAQHVEADICIKGWIYNLRTSKTNIFAEFRDGTGFCQCVLSLDLLGEEAFEQAKGLTVESSVIFQGKLIADERQLGGYELQVQEMTIVHISEGYPLTKSRDKDYGVNFLSEHRHLWLRRQRQWAIMRVRNQIIMGIHEFFQERGFVQMDAPIFMGSACEGTTDLFETDFFGRPAYLSQSGQLYGEAMAMAMGKIYTFGPTFRAEKSDTPRHLAEFWMIEPEMAYYTNEQNMELIEAFVKQVVGRVLKRCEQELKVLERDTKTLQRVVEETFPRITHAQAARILRGEEEVDGRNAIALQEADLQAAKDAILAAKAEIEEREAEIKKGQMKKGQRNFYEAKIIALRGEIETYEEQVRNIPKWMESARKFGDDEDFGNSDETVLTRVFGTPVMVYNWPTKIKAFYMKEVEGDPEHVKGVDLLAPEGYGEIIGGSERETDIAILERKIAAHELPKEDLEWYIDLRRYGSVPHAGFGMGLERMVRWLCALPHVRETLPFPRRYGHIKP